MDGRANEWQPHGVRLSSRTSPRRFAPLVSNAIRLASVTAALIGGVYLVAWLSGIAAGWSAAGMLTMKTNMSLALLLSGVALLLLQPTSPSRFRRILGAASAALVLSIGVITLCEYAFHCDLGIDELLATEAPGAVATLSPNRIGFPGSVSLSLQGIGLIALAFKKRLAPYLGLATCLTVMVPAIGFLYGISPFFKSEATGIAWLTVVALFSLGLGLMLTNPGRAVPPVLWRDDPGGALLRRVLAPALLVPLILGYLRVQVERLGYYGMPTGTGLFTLVLVLFFAALLWRGAVLASAMAGERERAMDQLAAEKDRLAVTLRSIGDAVIATDEAGRITVFNAVAEALTGYRSGEAVGRPLSEVFHIVNEETRQPAVSPADRVLKESIVVGLANHTALISRDGTERPIADSGAPIRDSKGIISGVVLVFRDETEQRRALAEREKLSAQRGLALKSARLGSWQYDPLAQVAHFDERCQVILGISGPEHSRDEILGWMHPEDLQRVGSELGAALAPVASKPYWAEHRIIRPDGRVRWVETHGLPVFEGTGPARRATSLVGTLADITDRKVAEEAQTRLASIVESSDDAIISKDLQGTIVTWNAAAERLLGYTADEVVGQSIEVIVPPERRNEEEEILGRMNAGERIVHLETQRRAKDGVTIDVSITVSPLRDRRGRLVGASKIMRDVRDQKRANEALRQSEGRFRALADSMPQLAWAAQPDGYITWYNRRWYEYTGTTPEQMEGWGWQSLHDPLTLPDVLRRWEESIATGTTFEMEFPLRGANGKFRRFLTRVLPLKAPDGQVLQWFGTNTDVTEIIEAQESLREASRIKDEFLSMASHELRTPLTTLRLEADTLSRSLRKVQLLDKRVEHKLSVMDSQFSRMEALVRTLLDVTRITAGRLVLDLAAFDLADLAREVIDRFESQAESLGSALHLRARAVAGVWDRVRIDQVMTNLVSNALKYGNGQPVEVSVDGDETTATLSIRDQGTGISLADHERIFERFERARDASLVTGLGLGLWIAKRLVEAHGGKISVESSPGQGSTFTVRLPRSAP